MKPSLRIDQITHEKVRSGTSYTASTICAIIQYLDEEWEKHPDKEKLIGTRTLVQPKYLEAFIEQAISLAVEQEKEKAYIEGRNAGFVEASKKADIWIKNAVEQDRKRIIDKVNSAGGIGGLNHLFDIINNK